MTKVILRIILGINIVALMLGTPPAYALFGIRIARKAIAARRAENMVSSTDQDTNSPAKDSSGENAGQCPLSGHP